MDWKGENGSNDRFLHSTRVGVKMWAVAMEAALREIIQVLEMDLIGFGNQLDGTAE